MAYRHDEVATVEPGDIPVERPAALSRLDALVGNCEMEASFEAGFFGAGSPVSTSEPE